jgi:uncharacterized protein YdeI (YjbR/CyaY-like superfamily)
MGTGDRIAEVESAVGDGSETLVVADVAAWRAWLDVNEDLSAGVWLVLAKKGTTSPTSLTYQLALLEALCSGWIDGQRASLDAATFRQRYTPRRRASLWSARNIEIVAGLVADGRMRPRGQAEIDRAKADGRWDRAYAGSATAQVPDDLAAALAASSAAASAFAGLNGHNRYAVLHRIMTAPSPSSRANRLAKLVGMLERGETPHPQ